MVLLYSNLLLLLNRSKMPFQSSHITAISMVSPSLTSARLNVITTALSTTFPALSRVTYTPCFCFPILFTFLFGMTVPELNAFRQLDTFHHLRN